MRRWMAAVLAVVLGMTGLTAQAEAATPSVELVTAYLAPTEWDDVYPIVFGLDWRTGWGAINRPGNSPVKGRFVYRGTLPDDAKAFVSVWESHSDGKQEVLVRPSQVSATFDRKVGSFGVLFRTPSIKIHGDRVYVASVELYSGGSQIATSQTTFALNYKLSALCSIPTFLGLTVRDTSKSFLSVVHLAASTLNQVAELGVKKLPKGWQKRVKKGLKATRKIEQAAGAGYELVDIAEAIANGENVSVILIVNRVKDAAAAESKTINVLLTAEEAVELRDALLNQGKKNGELIADACNVAPARIQDAYNNMTPAPTTTRPSPTKSPTATPTPTNSRALQVMKTWFGPGWIGQGATCDQILAIAKATITGKEKEMVEQMEPRVMAIKPTAVAIWTLSVSPESGDPYLDFYAPSGVTSKPEGRWGSKNGFYADFWDMLEASADFWAPYTLLIRNGQFVCEPFKRGQ